MKQGDAKRWELPPDRAEEAFEDKRPLYTPAEALAEAHRCLYCSGAPCIQACPTGIDVPTFIRKIGTGNLKGAARTILSANLLGQSCAQVCPVEVLCAGACVYTEWGREPIAIGRLQRYAVENTLATTPPLFQAQPPTGKRIALVGSGPASIAAAGLLALEGHTCFIYERKALPGGLNTLGIAPYKLKGPEALRELEWVLSLGRIELRTGIEVVETATGPGQVSATELLASHDAVFLGLGLGADARMGIPGAQGAGVHGATHLIERLKTEPGLTLEGARRALVIGGGNTALDIAHELALLGVEVAMVYRRSEEEMGGYAHELDAARLDGVRLLENRQPVEILREGGRVVAVRLDLLARGTPVPGAGETLPTDLVVMAIGQERATHVARAFAGVVLDARGRVQVDPLTHRTGNPKVWSGGDCVNGGKEVVNAVAEAKLAVRDIQRYLAGE
ncbi:FAD-dependent oxidoreductase [Stigmatella erecta]|uniref:Glutamate synthase (NADPH/NADH) small chain n=1 Tax=Stigmatella erecta TaxID=83460 RepID=A0A1I0L8P3_9BACT|nr:FAD-dependent oxidoreductase [Stigmatella erecta]SEU36006.1 glutamate synthase (NADPH/NADH) small chain [Stigmatella erecta]